jgi:8-oxo-dGTP pyrophosphatase MutT (NUDIX family)
MFPYLPEERQDEIKRLGQDYGQPLLRTIDLGVSGAFDPLDKPDRYGEVCMVVRRPNGRLLTMKKEFYPPNAFRLLTGGIKPGESIFDGLLRETHEETGLQVEVRRFLAAVAYQISAIEKVPVFYTFAFLLDEIGGKLEVIDVGERIEGFREIEPGELPELAEYLDSLGGDAPYSLGNWKDWGHFRAVIHRVVWEALEDSA